MTITLRRSRSPFQIGVLLALLVISAASAVFFDQVATSTARELGSTLGRLMYGGTALGAGVALVGVWRSGITGLLVERVGLISMACWVTGYGIAVLINSGARGVQFGGYMTAVALMCLWRAWQIGREARELATVEHLAEQISNGEDR
ncbi:hypothetical protein [Amycolatopsis sp. SID8362]|uniref:hypothetical protein n=1 Tax=Amycolatopsis sp. SID8362 TaxID=2690346 RepID=UPI00136B5C10|nr:hypothetical protein [Amycolatopsis sp. SID8362]NBH01929.1 hypothetical protein [Amycolatopsis sp. SID8362]NED38632.1 hypothetical protein [Amycolatopsis sp. SID8362]